MAGIYGKNIINIVFVSSFRRLNYVMLTVENVDRFSTALATKSIHVNTNVLTSS